MAKLATRNITFELCGTQMQYLSVRFTTFIPLLNILLLFFFPDRPPPHLGFSSLLMNTSCLSSDSRCMPAWIQTDDIQSIAQ